MHLLYNFIQIQESAYAAPKHRFLGGFGYVPPYGETPYQFFSVTFSVVLPPKV